MIKSIKSLLVFAAIVAVGLFSISCPCWAKDTEKDSAFEVIGSTWMAWPYEWKAQFVLGWLKCGIKLEYDLPIKADNLEEGIKFYKVQMETCRREGIVLGGVSIRQVINLVDSLYGDARVMPMDFSKVIYFAIGRLVYGWSARQIDELIALDVQLTQCEVKERTQNKIKDDCNVLKKLKTDYLSSLYPKFSSTD